MNESSSQKSLPIDCWRCENVFIVRRWHHRWFNASLIRQYSTRFAYYSKMGDLFTWYASSMNWSRLWLTWCRAAFGWLKCGWNCCIRPYCMWRYTIDIPWSRLCFAHNYSSCPDLWMSRNAWRRRHPRIDRCVWCKIVRREHLNNFAVELSAHRNARTIRHIGTTNADRSHRTRNNWSMHQH